MAANADIQVPPQINEYVGNIDGIKEPIYVKLERTSLNRGGCLWSPTYNAFYWLGKDTPTQGLNPATPLQLVRTEEASQMRGEISPVAYDIALIISDKKPH